MATRKDTLEISALGRRLDLGTLYDAREDAIVPGINIWATEDMNNHKQVDPRPKTDVRVEASDTLSNKTNLLDVSASVKASFFCGLVDVGGSAKYLDDNTSSSRQCRVTLQYSATTRHEELNIAELKILDAEILKTTTATHVVVEVTYGADALLEFEETASDVSNKQEVQGNLNVMIKKIPSIQISGEGNLNMNFADKEKAKRFKCKFFGDFRLKEPIFTYEQAVKAYRDLPSLLGKNGENSVPVKVWLYPLSKLLKTGFIQVKPIPESLVSDLGITMDDFHEAMLRTNYLLEKSKAVQAEDIVTKLEKFQTCLSYSTRDFKNKMAELIPAVREGSKKESDLRYLLQSKDASGLSGRDMKMWLDDKELEINTITQYIKEISQFQIKCENPDLQSFLRTPNVSLSFVFCFTSLQYEEPYLDKISGDSVPPQNPRVENPWYKNERAMKALQDSLDIFKHAPSNRSVISFIKDDKYPGASVRMYRNITLKNPHLTSAIQLSTIELTMDEDTAFKHIALSADKKTASYAYQNQWYPYNAKRFDTANSVLCAETLPRGKSYWECEFGGNQYVTVGVAYKRMYRDGSSAWVGGNWMSWGLESCKAEKYHEYHKDSYERISDPPPGTRRVGVYLDSYAGTMTFYSIDNTLQKREYWHTIRYMDLSNEELCAGFWIGKNGSVTLM